MPESAVMSDGQYNTDPSLLTASEPSPFYVVNPLSEAPVLLICDHASCRFPQALGDMGLDPFARRCHLAIDIGAGKLTEKIAKSLGFTAVIAQYSRLVIDCNRQLMDPGAFLEYGDGIVVPGNRNLTQADKDARADAIYWPYHNAIEDQITRLRAVGPAPAFISIHSFTPVLNGVARDVQMGVLWDKDSRLSDIFLEDSALQDSRPVTTNRILVGPRRILRLTITLRKWVCLTWASRYGKTLLTISPEWKRLHR